MDILYTRLKSEFISRINKAEAHTDLYSSILNAADMNHLCMVLKNNFWWFINNRVLTTDFIDHYRSYFSKYGINANVSVEDGFLLCDRAYATAHGNATVAAYGNAIVEATDTVTVRAFNCARVIASGNAKVEAMNSAMVYACACATVIAYSSSIVKAHGNVRVKSYQNAVVIASKGVEVEAHDEVCCITDATPICNLSDRSICFDRSSSRIYYADSDMVFLER